MQQNTTSSTIKLVEYNEHYQKQLSDFHLPEQQLEFTSLPLEKIHNPSISSDTVHVMIIHEGVPVGYFALEQGKKLLKYTDQPHTRLLTSFSIDSRHQGKGLAKKGLTLLPDFIKDTLPDIKMVVLGVNKRNQAAINLYLKTGFIDENELYEGPKGPQHVLRLKIR